MRVGVGRRRMRGVHCGRAGGRVGCGGGLLLWRRGGEGVRGGRLIRTWIVLSVAGCWVSRLMGLIRLKRRLMCGLLLLLLLQSGFGRGGHTAAPIERVGCVHHGDGGRGRRVLVRQRGAGHYDRSITIARQ